MKFKIIALFFTALLTNNFIFSAAKHTLVEPKKAKIITPKIAPKIEHPNDAAKSDIAKNTSLVAPIHPSQSTTTSINNVPFGPELQTAKIAPSIIQGWQALYQAFLHANNQGNATPPNNALLAQHLSANFFNQIKNYADPKTFPQFNNDPQGSLHFNYVTKHLHDAAARIGSVVSTHGSSNIAISSSATCRDLGIIVNWYNNTDAQFSINQTDGKTSTQIGVLEPGLNGLNLHLAALQTPAPPSHAGKQTTPTTTQYFSLTEQNASNPIQIFIKIMTGAELIAFLRTLYRDPKAIKDDTFEMNGLPTSPEYITVPTDDYLVLIQNPTPATSSKREAQQRIQAIDITKFAQPYLLTMQINAEEVNPNQPKDHEESAPSDDKILVYQPSITIAQLMMNSTIKPINFPIIILPDFADKNPELHALWMLATTTTLAAHTDFKLFGKDSFANAFEYFNNLSCFNNQNRYVFFIDLYNRFSGNYVAYNATWLMANNVLETNLRHCSDISQIYTAQDPYGHVIVNEHEFYYTNFMAMLIPDAPQPHNAQIFFQAGFNTTYANPFNQLYSAIINVLKNDIKEGVFCAATQIQKNVFQLEWTNKKNQILNKQTLYLNTQPANIQISFLNQQPTWIGSSVPTNLLPLEIDQTTHFKVTEEFSVSNNKHILLAQATSAIDKQAVFLPLQFSQYPLQELYIDVFNRFNIKPFTRCYVIRNGVLPDPLVSLSQQDWQAGIYMVPVIENNEKITNSNPGSLTLDFYDSGKNYLGSMKTSGQYNNGTETGIRKPVKDYALYISQQQCLRWLYLSSGVCLKYEKI